MPEVHVYDAFHGRLKKCIRCGSESLGARTLAEGEAPPANPVWGCVNCGKTGYIRDLPLLKPEPPAKKMGGMALADVLMAAHAVGALDEPTVESAVERQMKGRRRR